jgi:L-2-hydroxyglutarate oxidase LhgO
MTARRPPLVGIESPGLTAALAIAENVAKLLAG